MSTSIIQRRPRIKNPNRPASPTTSRSDEHAASEASVSEVHLDVTPTPLSPRATRLQVKHILLLNSTSQFEEEGCAFENALNASTQSH